MTNDDTHRDCKYSEVVGSMKSDIETTKQQILAIFEKIENLKKDTNDLATRTQITHIEFTKDLERLCDMIKRNINDVAKIVESVESVETDTQMNTSAISRQSVLERKVQSLETSVDDIETSLKSTKDKVKGVAIFGSLLIITTTVLVNLKEIWSWLMKHL